uniref:EF-hand domain-containing protein n=1 Tax=Strigamia maritima TaxID=126957 RepID=T1JCH2_STRMM
MCLARTKLCFSCVPLWFSGLSPEDHRMSVGEWTNDLFSSQPKAVGYKNFLISFFLHEIIIIYSKHPHHDNFRLIESRVRTGYTCSKMAASWRNFLRYLRPRKGVYQFSAGIRTMSALRKDKYLLPSVCLVVGTSISVLLLRSRRLHVVEAKQKKEEEPGAMRLTQRERRFMRFASIEYEGQLYMTPQDFLESVTEGEPRPRLKRRDLTKKELDSMLGHTPSVTKTHPGMFRSLRDNDTLIFTGIISYTEYLFLLSILTKPQTGFRIAFNMFDTDSNQKVDKQEFLVLEKIFSFARRAREKAHQEKQMRDGGGKINGAGQSPAQDKLDEILDSNPVVDTTLLLHFFGPKGKGYLDYEDFHKFMENLQTEVLELEFNEFSRGQKTISEVDFAKILLRYTLLHADDYEAYIDRLISRIPVQKGISFSEFKNFCQFLNNLDDFAIAMRMYTFADQPISQEEFHRAVKICMGRDLSNHLVHTVFQIFDEDGDGQLSYKEFIAIMRDRLHRGIKSHLMKNEGWDAFKSCVKEEMKSVA